MHSLGSEILDEFTQIFSRIHYQVILCGNETQKLHVVVTEQVLAGLPYEVLLLRMSLKLDNSVQSCEQTKEYYKLIVNSGYLISIEMEPLAFWNARGYS